MNHTEILAANGLANADAIVAAASRASTPLPVAAALAEIESNGKNVFGNDEGGAHATTPRTEVTPERVWFLRGWVAAGGTSNGIGPAQITWPPLFERADREGLDLADPEDNLVLGFEVLGEHLAARSGNLEEAGTLYNAGNLRAGVNSYGKKFAALVAVWSGRLNPAPAPAGGSSDTEGGPAVAVTKKTRQTEVNAFGASILGKQIDTDGFPENQPFQCVDVPKYYARWIHGVAYRAFGNGKDVAWNMSRLPGWKWIPATERGQAGDVASWGRPFGVSKDGTEYGHTAVLAADDDGGRLDVYQADGFTEGARVYRSKNSRTGLKGFARPPRYVAEEAAAASPATVGTAADSYTVRRGDTLGQIAQRAGTTVARLLALNPGIKDPNTITVGQVIRVSAPRPTTITVKAGEGPWQVSQRAGISLTEFYRLNGSDVFLKPGDVVKVAE